MQSKLLKLYYAAAYLFLYNYIAALNHLLDPNDVFILFSSIRNVCNYICFLAAKYTNS
jgi:hypothetical protein